MSKTDVVIEVLLEFLTPATAIGSTEYDDKAYKNLQDICYVHDYCYDLIRENAELKGCEASVQRSREYAIKHLKESIEIMTDLLKDLEGGEEFKVDHPQETVTEFADRCRECGAHYGRLLNQKWIPVSVRLPKIADVYRVTRYYPNNVMNPQYLVDACFFDGSNTWYNDNRINHDRAYADNVIAWQENPEPYEEEREVDE